MKDKFQKEKHFVSMTIVVGNLTSIPTQAYTSLTNGQNYKNYEMTG